MIQRLKILLVMATCLTVALTSTHPSGAPYESPSNKPNSSYLYRFGVPFLAGFGYLQKSYQPVEISMNNQQIIPVKNPEDI